MLRADRAVGGWGKKGPPGCRTPLPWKACCRIACDLATQGELDAAVYVPMGFDIYSRPAGALVIRVFDIIPATGNRFPRLAACLSPAERGRTSKVGAVDEVVSYSEGKRAAAGGAAVILAAAKRQLGEEFLFGLGYDWGVTLPPKMAIWPN